MEFWKEVRPLMVTKLFGGMLVLCLVSALLALSGCDASDGARASLSRQVTECEAARDKAVSELKTHTDGEREKREALRKEPCSLKKLTTQEPERAQKLARAKTEKQEAEAMAAMLKELVEASVAQTTSAIPMPELPVTAVHGSFDHTTFRAREGNHGMCFFEPDTQYVNFTGRTQGSWEQVLSFAKAWYAFMYSKEGARDVSFHDLGERLDSGLIPYYASFTRSSGSDSYVSDLTLYISEILEGDPKTIVPIGNWAVDAVADLPEPMQDWTTQMLMQAWNLLADTDWEESTALEQYQRESRWEGRIARRYIAAEVRQKGAGAVLISTYRFWIAQMAAKLRYFPAKKWMTSITPKERAPLSKAHDVYKKAFANM